VIVNLETDFPDEPIQAGGTMYTERDGRVDALTVTTVRFRTDVRSSHRRRGDDERGRAARGLPLRVPSNSSRDCPRTRSTITTWRLPGDDRTARNVGMVEGVEGTLEAAGLS